MNTKGFTLIESLIVLFICSIFLVMPTLALRKWQQVLEVEQFLSSFEKNLLFTQQMAIVSNVDTQILFTEQSAQFDFFYANEGRQWSQFSLKAPASISAQGPKKIIFKKGSGNNGNLSKFSFYWDIKKQIIEFQFQLGSGRYVKKVKPL